MRLVITEQEINHIMGLYGLNNTEEPSVNSIINEISQNLAKQLTNKFSSQTNDSESTIMSMINKFDQYKEGLDVSKRDITKYDYDTLKSLIITKEINKVSDTAFTKLKKLWDSYKKQLPTDQASLYKYEDSKLKSLVIKFYDMYPYLKEGQKNIMKYDYYQLNKFIRENYEKLITKVFTKKISKDPTFAEMGINNDDLLFYIKSYIENRNNVPKETKHLSMMTFRELENLVDGVLLNNKDKSKQNSDDISNVDVVYDNNNLLVFAPKNKEQCIQLGHDRPWCLSRKQGNPYYGLRLGGGVTIYYVIDKDRDYGDRNFANVILVNKNGEIMLADKTNRDDFSGYKPLEWSEITKHIPKLEGLKDIFKPIPLTSEEEYFKSIVSRKVGDNPYETFENEEDIEMWLKVNKSNLTVPQFGNLSPKLQRIVFRDVGYLPPKFIEVLHESLLSDYFNFRKKTYMDKAPFPRFGPTDIYLLSLPIGKKLKEENKEKYAKESIDGTEMDIKIDGDGPNYLTYNYIKLYGLDTFIENVPENITSFNIENNSNVNLNFNLPNSFKRFKNLNLFYAKNALNEFPDILKGMNSLELISIHNSPNIKEVPDWVADLPNLKALTLHNNSPDIKIGPKVQEKSDNGDLFLTF